MRVMAAGVQRVYGVNAVRVTQNDFNPLARLAAATPIVINHTNDFPTNWTETINQTFDAATRSPYVEWQNNSHPDVDTYHLLLGDTPLNPTPVITGGALAVLDANGNPNGVEIGFERLENIRPDVDTFISLEAIDSERGRSVRSQEVKFTIASTAFTLSSQKATVAVAAGGSATVPVTLNTSGALFLPNVWLTANLGGAPRGITAKFANAVEGFPDLTTTASTRDLEIKVDGSVADGIYPIVISGYNGDAKEPLTVQVVVGAGGKLYLPLINR